MPTIPLTPTPVDFPSSVFEAITRWPFEDAFVRRLLADDVPQRMKYGNGRLWAYVDTDKTIIAFGTLDLCEEYAALTDGRPHTYLPLLAVHPEHQGKGHGRSVMAHLLDEATCVIRANAELLHPAVFLDVYEESVAAAALYRKCGFSVLGTGPSVDPLNGKRYRIMAKRAI